MKLRRLRSIGRYRQTGIAGGLAGPGIITLALSPFNLTHATDYVVPYLALVAILGIASGLTSALLAAAASFLLVDFFFIPPIHSFTFSSGTDLAYLLAFFSLAGLVGSLGSRRRAGQIRAEEVAAQLGRANVALELLNVKQAEAAEVAVRLAQIQQRVDLLEEMDRLRRELLANVSHELRTPLTSLIAGTTSILAQEELAPGLRVQIGRLAQEARRLNRLVEDMLDMTRIEGRGLELQLGDVDLVEALTAAADRLRAAAPSRQVSVEAELDRIDVVADWDRLGQVLDNLLANAHRHSPPDSAIRLVAAPGRREMAVVHVIDQGPGVPLELRDHIFDRFVRDPSATPADDGRGGLGLGLAIVRGLLESQAGRVWIEDGTGGHFAFCLPLSDSVDRGENVNVDIVQSGNDRAQPV